MIPFIVLGAAVTVDLPTAMLRAPINATERPYHIAYSIDIGHGGLVGACYVAAVCGALLFSGYRHIEILAVVNLAGVAVLAWLIVDEFASLWCGYAALTAGAIALHMRYGKPHRATPYVLT